MLTNSSKVFTSVIFYMSSIKSVQSKMTVILDDVIDPQQLRSP